MTRCARCDAELSCGAVTGACWCASLDVPETVLAQLAADYRDCLCPECLERAIVAQATT